MDGLVPKSLRIKKKKRGPISPHQNPVLVLVKDLDGLPHVKSNNDFDLLKFSETQRKIIMGFICFF